MNHIALPRTLRSLGRTPAFAVASILALGLGIGASTALFSVIDGVLLRPLPYAAQDRLVIVDAERRGRPTIPSYMQFVDWRMRARSFDAMAYAFGDAFLVRGNNGTDATPIAMVSPGFFRLMGAAPTIGRVPSADEEQNGAARTIVISQRLWRGHFGSDPAVLGRTLNTDKASFVIVGVMPSGFAFPSWASAWTPLGPMADQFPAIQKRDWRADSRAIARLKPDVSPKQAQAELNAIAQSLASAFPASDAEMTTVLTPVVTEVLGDVRRPLRLLSGAVAVLLLIACANVGMLSLVRGSARARELAVRSALGASRRRIAALLLKESGVISIAAAVVGWVFARWGVAMLQVAAPSGLPRVDEIAVDGRSMAFTSALALITPLLFGLAPALSVARANLAQAIRVASRVAGRGSGEVRLRSGLLVLQVALSLVLLVSAGLLARSFAALRAIQPGYEPERLLDARVQPPTTRYKSPEALLAVYARLQDEIARLPRIEGVTVVNQQSAAGIRTDVRIAGQDGERGAEPRALYRVVGTDYFKTVGQRLLRGRGFASTEMTPASQVIVINARLASLLFPDSEPVGKRIRVWKQVPDRGDYGMGVDAAVIGVVANAVFEGPGGPALSAVYLPLPVNPTPGVWLMVRVQGSRRALIAPIRRAILSVDRDIPTDRVGPMTVSTWEAVMREFDLLLVGAFGAAAIVLAAVGLYGIVAYVMTQHRHEIGVRRALGATEANLLRHFVGEGVRLAAVGVVLGTPLAMVGGRLLRTTLFGVGSVDPPTLGIVAVLLVAVGALASYLPARRLSEITPLEALREE